MLGLGDDSSSINLTFPYSTPTPTVQANNWWENIITAGASTGFNILRDVYGGVQPGTIVQSSPTGTTVIRQAEGYPISGSGLNLTTGTGGDMSFLLIIGIAVIAVGALSSGGSKH